MLALLEEAGNPVLSAEITDYLSKFVEINVGAAHPISDRWGISVVCCALQLSIHGKTEVLRRYLESVIKWVADHYDDGNAGLAGPYSQAEEETAYLLGSRFEHTHLSRRSESYTATELLDLCSVLEEHELFAGFRGRRQSGAILHRLQRPTFRAEYAVQRTLGSIGRLESRATPQSGPRCLLPRICWRAVGSTCHQLCSEGPPFR